MFAGDSASYEPPEGWVPPICASQWSLALTIENDRAGQSYALPGGMVRWVVEVFDAVAATQAPFTETCTPLLSEPRPANVGQ
nr:hypothetical protein GCM10020063_030570 [Dactylosporangium thailandense]